MITGDLDRELGALIGEGEPGAPGTWRPGPSGPGSYASTVTFLLARYRSAHRSGHAGPGPATPAAIAQRMTARLADLDWVETAAVTGGGYLTVTVTAAALARLAVRITESGPACARSTALAGTTVTAPADPRLATAPSWSQAWDQLVATVSGRVAEAAGAQVRWINDAEHMADPGSPAPTGTGPVARAMTHAGADAVTFALARLVPGGAVRVDLRLTAAHLPANPAYAVRYAHAHAASTLRQAADLGLHRGEAVRFQPRLLAHPRERVLLSGLSWLPERVAGAARRRRPDVLARYLEGLATDYFDCAEHCPAVQPGTTEAAGPATAARLWLVSAAATALRAGLGLLGVAAPDRL